MDDEFTLIQACLAQPLEDTPRLVLADWYDEHGTTDAQAARSEWIRKTCGHNRKTIKTRMAGEPAWIRANLSRLWPRLAMWNPRSPGSPSFVKLLSGKVVFCLEVFSDRTGRGDYDSSRVHVYGSRGVTSFCSVTFLRASVLAPVAAADEPCAKIRFRTVPVSALTPGEWAVHRRPFECRSLVEVWDGLEGWDSGISSPTQRRYDGSMHKNPALVVRKAIDDSLTRWARGKAGTRCGTPAFAEEPPRGGDTPAPPSDSLAVPPKV